MRCVVILIGVDWLLSFLWVLVNLENLMMELYNENRTGTDAAIIGSM
jgi:hypothetical protein